MVHFRFCITNCPQLARSTKEIIITQDEVFLAAIGCHMSVKITVYWAILQDEGTTCQPQPRGKNVVTDTFLTVSDIDSVVGRQRNKLQGGHYLIIPRTFLTA